MYRILFLTPEFPPSKLTGGIRPSKFAKYMSRFGLNVTVLTFDHQDNTQLNLLSDLGQVRIETCGEPKKYIVNDLGVSYLIQAYRKSIKLAKELKPDYIIVSMPTFMNSLLAFILYKKLGIKYVLDYRDLWVADPYPVRGLKSKVFKLISRFLEPLILKSAYLSYYVSQEMLQDQLRSYPFLKNHQSLVISTGYDLDDIKGIKPSLVKNGYISHVGNADRDMNIEDFVSLISDEKIQLVLLKHNLRFLFVGRKNKVLGNLLDEETSRFVHFKDYVPHEEALQLMADSNGLVILGSNSEQRLNRKVFEYTALNANIFYLGNIKSPTSKVVSEYHGHISDRSNYKEIFIQYIENLSSKDVKPLSKYSKETLVRTLVEKL